MQFKNRKDIFIHKEETPDGVVYIAYLEQHNNIAKMVPVVPVKTVKTVKKKVKHETS